MANLKISVRELVEFLLRSGDLDNRTAGAPEDAMLAGASMHRRLQAEAGSSYRAEVPMALEWTYSAEDTSPAVPQVRLTDALSAVKGSHSTLRAQTSSEELPLTVRIEGRSDGLYEGEDPLIGGSLPFIDEIKTTYRKLRNIRRPEEMHLSQAKCYAYMYAAKHSLARVGVRMTYGSLLTGELRYFYEVYEFEEIEAWFTQLMELYRPWAEFRSRWAVIRTDSIHALEFPFPYRPGQKDLAAAVYRTIVLERRLFLEAPTGTGKTISTLFPAVKALGEGKASAIFYLTARTIARTAAENALSSMRALRLKSVTLTAREKICVLDKPQCNPEDCPRAKGHYSRVNEAMYDLLMHEDAFTRTAIEACADRHMVCPFELGLDMSLYADLVIGDYNYVFSPRAGLRRFFTEGAPNRGEYIFLIDEAHNLVDRGRELYSAALVREDILALRRRVKDIWPKLARALSKCSRELLAIRKAMEEGPAAAEDTSNSRKEVSSDQALPGQVPRNHILSFPFGNAPDQTGEESPAKTGPVQRYGPDRTWCVLNDIDDLGPAAEAVHTEIAAILSQERIAEQSGAARRDPQRREKKAVRDDLLTFYFDLDHFLSMLAGKDGNYVIYAQKYTRWPSDPADTSAAAVQTASEGILPASAAHTARTDVRRFMVRLFCADPSRRLAECMDRGRASILFSATLLPINYYKSLLGGTKEDYEIYAQSVFDPARLGLFIVRDLSSRYLDRTPDNYDRIADCIWRVIRERHGNYMVFFPSYAFLEEIAGRLLTLYPIREGILPSLRAGNASCGTASASMGTGAAAAQTSGPADVNAENRYCDAAEDEIILLRQKSRMTEEEREAFLSRFGEIHDDRSLIGLCVMGGIFSEGIDLQGDALIGVIVVGTGIPQVNPEHEILKEYFDEHGDTGYDYAYRCPGMNKVQQAAGRVIRTPQDVGIVVLIDDRFVLPSSRRLFPREWQDARVTDSRQIGHLVERFWDEWL